MKHFYGNCNCNQNIYKAALGDSEALLRQIKL